MLLATPIVVAVLRALSDGARRQSELRQLAGSPAQTTLRAQLKRLEEIGAIERHRRNAFPGVLEYELTAAGRELLVVLDVLERWLERAPEEPLPIGGTAAKAAVKALADGWSTNVLRALAAGALSLTELDGVIKQLSYPSLERRLASMRLAGLVEPRPGNGRATPYAVTRWLRQGVGPFAAAARWERRRLPERTPPWGDLDVETAFLLTVPRLRPASDLTGSCRLAIEMSNGEARRLAGVVVELRNGQVTSCTTNLEGRGDAWALGSPTAWLNAVVDGDLATLEFGGHSSLSRSLVEGLHRALFEVRAQPC